MLGEQTALDLLNQAGFSDVDARRVDTDFLNTYYIARKQWSAAPVTTWR